MVLNSWEVREASQVTLEWGRDKKGRGTRQGHQVEADTPWHYRKVLRGGGVAVGMWRRGHPVDQAGGELSFALKVLAWGQSDLRQWRAESGQSFTSLLLMSMGLANGRETCYGTPGMV